MKSRCRIDTCDPELTEGPFLRAPVTIGILHALVHVMLGNGKDLASRSPVAFRLAEKAFATAMGGNFVLRAWHKLRLFLCCCGE